MLNIKAKVTGSPETSEGGNITLEVQCEPVQRFAESAINLCKALTNLCNTIALTIDEGSGEIEGE